MKTFDMNIDVDESKMGQEKDKFKIISGWIGQAIMIVVNKPDNSGRPTGGTNLDELRKYTKVMDKLENHKDGIVVMDDDDFDYMYRKFHQAQFPLDRALAKLLVDIAKKMDEAKNG